MLIKFVGFVSTLNDEYLERQYVNCEVKIVQGCINSWVSNKIAIMS